MDIKELLAFGVARGCSDLHAPAVLQDIASLLRGMVLVTGSTGSGKFTTLAAMLDHKNETEYCHILTVEDPIDFVHESKQAGQQFGMQTLERSIEALVSGGVVSYQHNDFSSQIIIDRTD